jgi:hypothetical protein
MALPPRSLGNRVRAVGVERLEMGWRATVEARPLPGAFGSEGEARAAAAAEVARLDALALALLRRARSCLGRKGS